MTESETKKKDYADDFLAVVLAGGEASRFEGLPKWLLPIHGKSMLEYNIENMYEAGIRKIAVLHSQEYKMDIISIAEKICQNYPNLDNYRQLVARSLHIKRGADLEEEVDPTNKEFLAFFNFGEEHYMSKSEGKFKKRPLVSITKLLDRFIDEINIHRNEINAKYVVVIHGDSFYSPKAIEEIIEDTRAKLVNENDVGLIKNLKNVCKRTEGEATKVRDGKLVGFTKPQEKEAETAVYVFDYKALKDMMEESSHKKGLPEFSSHHSGLRYICKKLLKKGDVHVADSEIRYINMNDPDDYRWARWMIEHIFKEEFRLKTIKKRWDEHLSMTFDDDVDFLDDWQRSGPYEPLRLTVVSKSTLVDSKSSSLARKEFGYKLKKERKQIDVRKAYKSNTPEEFLSKVKNDLENHPKKFFYKGDYINLIDAAFEYSDETAIKALEVIIGDKTRRTDPDPLLVSYTADKVYPKVVETRDILDLGDHLTRGHIKVSGNVRRLGSIVGGTVEVDGDVDYIMQIMGGKVEISGKLGTISSMTGGELYAKEIEYVHSELDPIFGTNGGLIKAERIEGVGGRNAFIEGKIIANKINKIEGHSPNVIKALFKKDLTDIVEKPKKGMLIIADEIDCVDVGLGYKTKVIVLETDMKQWLWENIKKYLL